MPMYLVRWQNGDTEIVAARNDDDLAWGVLDQVSDPYGAAWHRVPPSSPLWLGVEVNTTDGTIREVVPHDVSPCDERGGMNDWILRMAFPEVHAVMRKHDNEAPPVEIEQALARDLATFPPPGRGWRRVTKPRPKGAGAFL